jgi:hypothetical protein
MSEVILLMSESWKSSLNLVKKMDDLEKRKLSNWKVSNKHLQTNENLLEAFVNDGVSN